MISKGYPGGGGILAFFFFLLFWGPAAWGGESGAVTCRTPGCGYRTNLTIGGGMRSPALTGYCANSHGFVRVKLKNWDQYRQPAFCPQCRARLLTIYGNQQVSQIPCPRCGKTALKYQRRLLFD